jgi:hypothetical protein
MTLGTGRRLLVLLALGAAIAVPAAGAATAGCPADTKLVHTVTVTLGKSLSLSGEQVKLLLQLVSLQSSRQQVPPELLSRLRDLTDQNRRVLVSGEKRLAALPPGTPQGRAFKKASLRYLREAVRPENECIGKAVAAKTLAELDQSVQCFEAAKQKDTALQRLVNSTITKLKTARRCTLKRGGR